MKTSPPVPLFLAALLAMLPGMWSSGRAQTIEWTQPFESRIFSPTLLPNVDSPSGVAVCSGKEIVVLDGQGAIQSRARLGDETTMAPTVADLDGDGQVEMLAILTDGTLVCTDHAGERQWRYPLGRREADGIRLVTCADVHPSPGLEVLAGIENGWLHCFSAAGKILWRFHGEPYRVGPMAVGDLDADGHPEIVYGTDNGHLYCLTGHGTLKWRFEEKHAPYGRSGPTLADLDGDGKAEILITRSNVGRHNCLIAVSHQGDLLWRTDDEMQGYVSTAVADLDGDGNLEILHCDKGNHVYCENRDGSRRWMATVEGRGIFRAPAVADVDGDGELEIVVGVRDQSKSVPHTSVYILDSSGKIESRLQLAGGAHGGPAIGDVDGDGQLELLLSLQGPDRLVCVSWNAAGRVASASLRRNSAMTGAHRDVPAGTPGATRPLEEIGEGVLHAEQTFAGENCWQAHWTRPAPDGAFVECSVRTKDGRRETFLQDVPRGARDAIVRPFIPSVGAAAEITVRLLAGSRSQALWSKRKTVTAQPPATCNIEQVRAKVELAVSSGSKRGADTLGLAADLARLEAQRQRIERIATEGADGRRLAEAATVLRRQAGVLATRAGALDARWRQGDPGPFTVTQDANPWARFDPREIPCDSPLPARIKAFGDEYEPIVLTLSNISSKPQLIRATFGKPNTRLGAAAAAPELASHITLHRLLPVATSIHGTVYDPLPQLDRSQSIDVPAGEARQLWLTVHTRGLEPGLHRLTLYLGLLAQEGSQVIREVPIEIEVWPVTLPQGKYQLINWVSPNRQSDQSLRCYEEHGGTIVYGPPLPTVRVDAEGNRVGAIDWSNFDAQIARHPDHFIFLFHSFPRLLWPKGTEVDDQRNVEHPVWRDDNPYVHGVGQAIDAMTRHLQSLGIGYDRWAFYPLDEPWNTGATLIPELRRFCSLVKKVHPKARNYTDPTGGVRWQYLEEFRDLIDIWQCGRNALCVDPELLQWFRDNAKTFWYYEAPGLAKELLPLGHYRTHGWLGWRFGTSGHGFWVYNRQDLWWGRPHGGYNAVYANGSDVVTSRRWEAERDGLEDWRALYVLREEIEKALASGDSARAQAAQSLLDESVEAVTAFQVKHINQVNRFILDYELDFDMLMDFRSRIATAIIGLRETESGK